jgi:hypothetical protein
VVLRPVNDRFFDEIVFPVFEMGMVSAQTALTRLRAQVADPHAGVLLDSLIDRGAAEGAALWGLDHDLWFEAVHRLLFWEWEKAADGWRIKAEYPGCAGNWDDFLHVALMLEAPRYPYDDPAAAAAGREKFSGSPPNGVGLASLLAGRWDPCPRFPAHEVLTTIPDRGRFKPGDDLCIADWSYRSAGTVAIWTQQLATKLGRLIRREQTRLAPVEMPEAKELLDFWTGRAPHPPQISVAFSGLGPQADGWIRLIGELATQLRGAASRQQGVTVMVTPGSRTMDENYL